VKTIATKKKKRKVGKREGEKGASRQYDPSARPSRHIPGESSARCASTPPSRETGKKKKRRKKNTKKKKRAPQLFKVREGTKVFVPPSEVRSAQELREEKRKEDVDPSIRIIEKKKEKDFSPDAEPFQSPMCEGEREPVVEPSRRPGLPAEKKRVGGRKNFVSFNNVDAL